MRVGALLDAFGKRLTLHPSALPASLLHALVELTLAHAIMLATKLGVFVFLINRPQAQHQLTNHSAMGLQTPRKLLNRTFSLDRLVLKREWIRLNSTSSSAGGVASGIAENSLTPPVALLISESRIP
jgi:hypothetical protein